MADQLPIFVLAGGKSRRFGSDKALADVRGEPAIKRLADLLRPFASQVIAVADIADKYSAVGVNTIQDAERDLGPIGGLYTALKHSWDVDWLMLVSCDWLYVRQDWIELLLRSASEGKHAVAFRGDYWEPLFALYHRSILPFVEKRIHSGQLAMNRLLNSVECAELAIPSDWPSVVQMNREADLQQFLEA